MAETLSRRTFGIRYLIGAVLTLAIVILLNATKPVWLSPPLFAYTPLVYIILALAWLPLLYFALTHLMGRRKLLVLVLVLLTTCGQWFCWASIAPRRQVLELFPGGAFSERRCEITSPDQGKTHYSCELRVSSSDRPDEWILTQEFAVWDNLPFMWLLESDFSIVE